jgi:hypothetical protein
VITRETLRIAKLFTRQQTRTMAAQQNVTQLCGINNNRITIAVTCRFTIAPAGTEWMALSLFGDLSAPVLWQFSPQEPSATFCIDKWGPIVSGELWFVNNDPGSIEVTITEILLTRDPGA